MRVEGAGSSLPISREAGQDGKNFARPAGLAAGVGFDAGVSQVTEESVKVGASVSSQPPSSVKMVPVALAEEVDQRKCSQENKQVQT